MLNHIYIHYLTCCVVYFYRPVLPVILLRQLFMISKQVGFLLYFRLPYAAIFGGVSAMTKDQILFVNGFSNKFSGWGGEDDDMFNR